MISKDKQVVVCNPEIKLKLYQMFISSLFSRNCRLQTLIHSGEIILCKMDPQRLAREVADQGNVMSVD